MSSLFASVIGGSSSFCKNFSSAANPSLANLHSAGGQGMVHSPKPLLRNYGYVRLIGLWKQVYSRGIYFLFTSLPGCAACRVDLLPVLLLVLAVKRVVLPAPAARAELIDVGRERCHSLHHDSLNECRKGYVIPSTTKERATFAVARDIPTLLHLDGSQSTTLGNNVGDHAIATLDDLAKQV